MTRGRPSLRGQISAIPVHELLMAAEASARSGEVRIIAEAGEGTVWFREGVLVDAQLGALVGEDAINRLVGVASGRYEVEYTSVSRPLTIGRSVHRILSEHAARRSRWRQLLGSAPDLHAVLVPVDGCASYRPEADLIALFDGRRCMLDVIDSSGRDPVDALRDITGLVAEGVLVELVSVSDDSPMIASMPEIPRAPRLPSGELEAAAPSSRREAAPGRMEPARSPSHYSVRPNSVEAVNPASLSERERASSARATVQGAGGREGARPAGCESSRRGSRGRV